MLAIDKELKSLIEKLNEHRIPYALCGGLAMAVHGHPRATLDIDLIALNQSGSAIEKVAREIGYTLRAAPKQFAGGQVGIARVSKASADSEDVLPLDILTLDPSIEDAIGFEEVAWEGTSLRVVNRAGLIKLKQFRNNRQDLADIEKLTS